MDRCDFSAKFAVGYHATLGGTSGESTSRLVPSLIPFCFCNPNVHVNIVTSAMKVCQVHNSHVSLELPTGVLNWDGRIGYR
jgi:hypothetical protein